jgi:hypothetical protein
MPLLGLPRPDCLSRITTHPSAVWHADCWQAYNRSVDGVQIANASLFPSGMKSLADWLHAKGFKLGLCEHVFSLSFSYLVPLSRNYTGIMSRPQIPTRGRAPARSEPARWATRRRTPRPTRGGAWTCSNTTPATSHPARTQKLSTRR